MDIWVVWDGRSKVALEGNPGEEYVYDYGENISMRDWMELLSDVGSEEGYWDEPEIVQRNNRYRPGDSDVEELLAGYEKLHEETGWDPGFRGERGLDGQLNGILRILRCGWGELTGDD